MWLYAIIFLAFDGAERKTTCLEHYFGKDGVAGPIPAISSSYTKDKDSLYPFLFQNILWREICLPRQRAKRSFASDPQGAVAELFL